MSDDFFSVAVSDRFNFGCFPQRLWECSFVFRFCLFVFDFFVGDRFFGGGMELL